jgi:signal peptidase I
VNDLYSLLGVPADASPEEIREAFYRRLRFDDLDSDEGNARTRELREAYDVLSDPARRRSYDASQGIRTDSPPFVTPEPLPEHDPRNPVTRATRRLPRGWRITFDWIVTIVGAVAIVLAIKAWVINPYRIPSSSMEPTLHCARPGNGCEARFSDRVLANRFIYHFRKPHRGDIIVFKTPPLAKERCGAGGTFVKRLVALPGETWQEKNGYVYIDGKKLIEPYVKSDRRDTGTSYPARQIPPGMYFMMGDNRTQSCDSREWGPVPRGNLIGEVFAVYWPPNRIGFR